MADKKTMYIKAEFDSDGRCLSASEMSVFPVPIPTPKPKPEPMEPFWCPPTVKGKTGPEVTVRGGGHESS